MRDGFVASGSAWIAAGFVLAILGHPIAALIAVVVGVGWFLLWQASR